MLNNLLYLLRYINLKTLRFNFHYLPFHKAIRLPIFISNNVKFISLSGEVTLADSAPIYPGKIKIGFYKVNIFDKSGIKTLWEVKGKIIFKGTAFIGHGTALSIGENGTLRLGKNFTITTASKIIANNFIEFGDNCLLSWEIMVMDDDFHKIIDEQNNVLNKSKPIIIGNGNWIGFRTTILKGTLIEHDNVIASCSLLNREIKGCHNLLGGTPAKILKSNISWNL